jgi:hypothetical protein
MLKLPGILFVVGLSMLALGIILFCLPINSKVEWAFAVLLSCAGGSLTVIGGSMHVIK